MSLVVFTGLVGLMVAPGHLHPVLRLSPCCASRSAPAPRARINMWYDRDIDAVMRRTRKPADPGRPHRSGRGARLRRRAGGRLGDADGAGGQLAGRRAAGAVDRLLRLRLHDVAEAAHAAEHRDRRRRRRVPAGDRLGGGDRRRRARLRSLLFAIIFFWTPPHFWALALYRTGDYATAGVPMLPVVAGARATKRADADLHAAAVAAGAGAVGARPLRAGLSASRPRSLGLLFIAGGGRASWFDSGERRGPADVRLLDPLSVPAVRAAVVDRAPACAAGACHDGAVAPTPAPNTAGPTRAAPAAQRNRAVLLVLLVLWRCSTPSPSCAWAAAERRR